MFPVLYAGNGWSISAYGFFAALGYAAAVLVARRQAAAAGFPPATFSNLCLLALITGLGGARILFVATNPTYFQGRPQDILLFWSGGLVFYGGFLLALPVSILYLRLRRLPILPSLDALAPALAIGHAIGRLGCFAAGCCHGGVCPYPWGIPLHSHLVEPTLRGLPLHPTQIYESAGLFALGGTLLWLSRRHLRPGSLALVYVIGYAALRAVVEVFRGDSLRGSIAGTGLSTSQLIALGLFAVAGAIALGRLRRDH